MMEQYNKALDRGRALQFLNWVCLKMGIDPSKVAGVLSVHGPNVKFVARARKKKKTKSGTPWRARVYIFADSDSGACEPEVQTATAASELACNSVACEPLAQNPGR